MASDGREGEGDGVPDAVGEEPAAHGYQCGKQFVGEGVVVEDGDEQLEVLNT